MLKLLYMIRWVVVFSALPRCSGATLALFAHVLSDHGTL